MCTQDTELEVNSMKGLKGGEHSAHRPGSCCMVVEITLTSWTCFPGGIMREQKFIRSAIIMFPKHLNFFYGLVLWPQVRTSHRLSKHYGCRCTPNLPALCLHSHLCESPHPWQGCLTADSSPSDGLLLSSPFLESGSHIVNIVLVCIS